MSGAEVIGIISGIIAILDAAVKVYSVVKDSSNLPPAFRDAARRIPLIQDTLRTAEMHLKEYDQDEAYKTMRPTLEGCKDKAEHLREIFQKVTAQDKTLSFERYSRAARALGKRTRVESIMKGMLEDVHLLTENHAIKAATEAQVGKLVEAISEMSAIQPSLPDDGSSFSFQNSGSGSQNVNTGSGTQNINAGTGYQFNGTFQAPFEFPALLPSL